jgi:hypothetical protein
MVSSVLIELDAGSLMQEPCQYFEGAKTAGLADAPRKVCRIGR